MKKLYSIILLLAFVVGTLQPILPMIEYQLQQGDLTELMEEGLSGDLDLKDVISSDKQDCSSQDSDESLLDTDYYPLALQIRSIPKPVIFPHISAYYPIPLNKVVSPSFLPNPPPPRLS